MSAPALCRSPPLVATPTDTDTWAGWSAKWSRTDRRRRSATAIAAPPSVSRQDQRELLPAEPGRDVGRARAGAQQPRERLQHAVAGGVAQRVVDALEVVEVADQQRDRAAAGDGGLHARLEAAAVAQARQRVVLGEVAHPGQLVRRLDRGRRLVGERAQRLEPARRRDEAIGGVVDPDHADHGAGAAVERDEQPVAVPGAPAAAAVRAADRPRAARAGRAAAHRRAPAACSPPAGARARAAAPGPRAWCAGSGPPARRPSSRSTRAGRAARRRPACRPSPW